MHWKYNTKRVVTPTIPFYKLGENYDLTLTLVTGPGENFDRTYLSVVDEKHAGRISAKRSGSSDYKALGGLFNANCYLGHVPEGGETSIDFRVNLGPGGPEGLTMIPVVLGHGDSGFFSDMAFDPGWPELWKNEWGKTSLWKTEWTM